MSANGLSSFARLHVVVSAFEGQADTTSAPRSGPHLTQSADKQIVTVGARIHFNSCG